MTRCENCGRVVREVRDACVLEAMLSCVADRENLTDRTDPILIKVLDTMDLDRFWSDLAGPAIDALQDTYRRLKQEAQ